MKSLRYLSVPVALAAIALLAWSSPAQAWERRMSAFSCFNGGSPWSDTFGEHFQNDGVAGFGNGAVGSNYGSRASIYCPLVSDSGGSIDHITSLRVDGDDNNSSPNENQGTYKAQVCVKWRWAWGGSCTNWVANGQPSTTGRVDLNFDKGQPIAANSVLGAWWDYGYVHVSLPNKALVRSELWGIYTAGW